MRKNNPEKFVKDLNKFVEKYGCSVEKDNDGQIVIYTGMMKDDDGNVIPFLHPLPPYEEANEQ